VQCVNRQGEAALRRFVVGDVHGQFEGLMLLIDKINLQSDDQVYFLGDLIDRGPRSAEVVEWVKVNKFPCIKGNHEIMCLDAYSSPDSTIIWQGWLVNGGARTLQSYGDNGISDEHLEWLWDLPLYIDLGDIWLVHAGVNPLMPLEEQTSTEFCWIREEFHSSNVPYFPDKTIITGHTITFTFSGVQPGQIVKGAGWIDIDTGAYHPKSGWLTALDVDAWMVHQTNVFSKRYRCVPLADIVLTYSPP
jgi:Calcineurin-like phosphoesterase.